MTDILITKGTDNLKTLGIRKGDEEIHFRFYRPKVLNFDQK